MTLATQIEEMKLSIEECIDLRDAAYLNFDLTEEEVMEEVAYYEATIADCRERIRGLEVWA